MGICSGNRVFLHPVCSILCSKRRDGSGTGKNDYDMDIMCLFRHGGRHDQLKKCFSYEKLCVILYNSEKRFLKGDTIMKHVKTLNTRKLQNTIKKGGCGECQTSCQSACKTSCTVGNQTCENK